MEYLGQLKFIILLLAISLIQHAALANPEAENLFQKGYDHYEQKQYKLAIPVLEKAIALVPENAQYHHILAKSYGRNAEQSNWISAISLAKKTLKHLEIAANLDKENVEILDDLMDYYREAPGFLGGSEKKADEIEVLIRKLSHKQHETMETSTIIE